MYIYIYNAINYKITPQARNINNEIIVAWLGQILGRERNSGNPNPSTSLLPSNLPYN